MFSLLPGFVRLYRIKLSFLAPPVHRHSSIGFLVDLRGSIQNKELVIQMLLTVLWCLDDRKKTQESELMTTKSEEQDVKIDMNEKESADHRLTLRIPKWLVDKIDEKRTEKVGKISRNLWILKQIEKAILD